MEDTENTPQSFFKQSAPPNVIKSSSIGRNVTGISFDTNGIPHEVKAAASADMHDPFKLGQVR